MERIVPPHGFEKVLWSGRLGRSTPYDLLTVFGACQRLHMSRSRLYMLVKSGQLKSLKVGNRRVFRRDALEAFIKQRTESKDVTP